jgi:hypothetical protein
MKRQTWERRWFLRTRGANAEEPCSATSCTRQDALRTAQPPAQHAYPIPHQAAIGGMVDGRFHHHAVHPQLPSPGHFQRLRQRHDPLVERLEGAGPDQVGPAQQRGVVRHRGQIKATELAQDQAIGHKVFGLLVAPVVQPLDDQQPLNHLHGCGGPSARGGVGRAAAQVGFDAMKERIVCQQLIELRQDGIHGQAQRGHQGKQVHGVIAIAQHRALLLGICQ